MDLTETVEIPAATRWVWVNYRANGLFLVKIEPAVPPPRPLLSTARGFNEGRIRFEDFPAHAAGFIVVMSAPLGIMDWEIEAGGTDFRRRRSDVVQKSFNCVP